MLVLSWVDGRPTLELELDLQFSCLCFFAPSIRRWCTSYIQTCMYLAKLQSRLVQPGVQIQGHTGQRHDKGQLWNDCVINGSQTPV